MSRIVLVNGAEMAPGAVAISPDDRGFTLGDGLFETVRAYAGRPFRLDAHLERLARGAARIGLPPVPDLRAQVLAAVALFVDRHGGGARRPGGEIPDAALRITLTRGAGEVGLAPREPAEPTLVVTVRPYAPRPTWYRDGVSAVTAPGRLNEFSATAGIKALGYLDAVVALYHARAHGADDAVFLDTRGHLAEATAANVFLVMDDGSLATPPPECGILPGITRAAVIEVAREAGIAAEERPLPADLVVGAREAFLTSSLREIVPLCRLDGRPVGDGRPGEVTLRLLGGYRELIRRELEASTPSDRDSPSS